MLGARQEGPQLSGASVGGRSASSVGRRWLRSCIHVNNDDGHGGNHILGSRAPGAPRRRPASLTGRSPYFSEMREGVPPGGTGNEAQGGEAMAAVNSESRNRPIAVGLALLMIVGVAGWMPDARADGDGQPRMFDTPAQAVNALVLAAEKNDSDAILAIYGAVGKELVQDASDPQVRSERGAFASAARDKAQLRTLEDGSKELLVGRTGWPLPILIVSKDGKWYFDAEEGKEEILLRRIGRNELTALRIADIYSDAQVAYASKDRDGDEVREYAQRILSTTGKHDGLYWETEATDVEHMSPLGPSVITLEEYLKADDKSAIPFNGYYWKILKGQGENAPGGAHSYIINGNMITGFALVGVPAAYGSTGIMTFIVSHHGEIFEKDLGENGIEAVAAMDTFDPDESWKPVEPAAEEAVE